MADVYELLVSADLPAGLTEHETAELRWHLGFGPQPDTLRIVTDFAEVFVDDDGQPQIEDNPYAILGRREPAWRIGGALFSELLPRDDDGWALTARQEAHPDDFEKVAELLRWLEQRAARFACHARFYEDETFTPVRNGELPG